METLLDAYKVLITLEDRPSAINTSLSITRLSAEDGLGLGGGKSHGQGCPVVKGGSCNGDLQFQIYQIREPGLPWPIHNYHHLLYLFLHYLLNYFSYEREGQECISQAFLAICMTGLCSPGLGIPW